MGEQRVTIIIPCKEIDEHTKKCVKKCLELNYSDFEIIVLPDAKNGLEKNKKVLIIETGKVKPSTKRNVGMKNATGEFFAFIDSDAYPEKNWLKNALKYFRDKNIGLVGGPNLTPHETNFFEKVSGYSLANYFTSGDAYIRYKKSKSQFVKELPSCNYISRKKISPKYDGSFLTAEDSKFCFDIAKKGYKILYSEEIVVYHHRRDSLKKHLKQIFIYARDIAWIIKKKFSVDKLYYSILSIFVFSFFMGIILSFLQIPLFIKIIFWYLVLIYLLIISVTSIHESFKMSFNIIITSILTHFSYGIGFIYGILTKKK